MMLMGVRLAPRKSSMIVMNASLGLLLGIWLRGKVQGVEQAFGALEKC